MDDVCTQPVLPVRPVYNNESSAAAAAAEPEVGLPEEWECTVCEEPGVRFALGEKRADGIHAQ